MHVSFTLARGSHELGSMNLCRMLQNAIAGIEEVIEHGGEKNTFSSKGGLTSLLLA